MVTRSRQPAPRQRMRTQSPSEEEIVDTAVQEDEVEVEVAPAPRNAQRAPQHVTRSDVRDAGHAPAHTPARKRRRRATVDENIFYIPVEEIPEGLTYEFKRWTNVGQEDPFYIARQREQGWEPVDPKRHPNWVPPDYNQPYIIKGGQILMERPKELTEEAQAENRQLARRLIREAEQRLGKTPDGELTRQHPSLRNGVVKEVMRPVIVAEE